MQKSEYHANISFLSPKVLRKISNVKGAAHKKKYIFIMYNTFYENAFSIPQTYKRNQNTLKCRII